MVRAEDRVSTTNDHPEAMAERIDVELGVSDQKAPTIPNAFKRSIRQIGRLEKRLDVGYDRIAEAVSRTRFGNSYDPAGDTRLGSD